MWFTHLRNSLKTVTAENRRMMLNYFPLTEALETTAQSPLKCPFQRSSHTWRMICLEKAIILKMEEEEGTCISSTLRHNVQHECYIESVKIKSILISKWLQTSRLPERWLRKQHILSWKMDDADEKKALIQNVKSKIWIAKECKWMWTLEVCFFYFSKFKHLRNDWMTFFLLFLHLQFAKYM